MHATHNIMHMINCTVAHPLNTGDIYWYEAMSTINSFKQPKHLYALEFKLANFKNFINCKNIVCLPDHNNQPTIYVRCWVYDLHSFPGQGLLSAARTFLSFVPLTFISTKSAFLCN